MSEDIYLLIAHRSKKIRIESKERRPEERDDWRRKVDCLSRGQRLEFIAGS